jgi:serine/threonine protein kinase
MTNHGITCDDDSLMSLLRGESARQQSDAILDHLEGCERCQQRLSDLVASGDEWKRATEAISACHDDTDDLPSFSAPTFGQQPIAWTQAMAQQLLSPASHPELLGRLGRYDIERLIGSGGMGIVFKAHDIELNRPVAIKILAPYLASSGPARKRFSREARAAAAVVHQHVVPIHNVETERDSPFIVMQYVSGESLQERIDREGALELCEILRIGMQVADGLSAAHQQGLVHRDIKPSNILLEEDVDRALINDFGLARAADDASLTRTGFHPGTPQYMSPEQASGQSVDARSDLFSLGSTLYTMCTGRPPFRAENSLGIMRQITDSDPTPIQEINSRIPAWLCAIVARLMAKDGADRFQTAAETRDLLGQCLSHVQQPTAIQLPDIPNYPSIQAKKLFISRPQGVLLMTSVVLTCSLIGVLALFAPPKPQQEQAGSKSKIAAEEHEHGRGGENKVTRLSWKELLGKDAPADYPTEVLSLIEGLNNGRGEWVFAAKTIRDGKATEFEAEMQIQGGFKDKIQQGRFPQWQIAIAWPREKPVNTLLLNVMALPEPTGIKLMLIPGFVIDGKPTPGQHKMYAGVWDAKASTVTWTPQQIRLPEKGKSPAPTAEGEPVTDVSAAFELKINANGELRISGYQHNKSMVISGQTAARVGEPFVEKSPTLEKLPNGYKVFFAGRTEVYIVTKDGECVVGPRVEKVGCEGNLIFGRVIKYDHAPENSDTLGYFWLDSTTGESSKGLELAAWREALKSKGVGQPRLAAPEQVGERY